MNGDLCAAYAVVLKNFTHHKSSRNYSGIMKIIIAVHHFLPRYYAGAELIAYRQARWLLNHGVDVEVISIDAIDRGQTRRD